MMMAITEQRPKLRFEVGDRLECWCNEQWLLGVVVDLWWAHSGWPPGHAAPYQIQLQDGSLVFAPQDTEQYVREAAPLLEGQSDEPRRSGGHSYSPPAPAMLSEEISWRKATAPSGQPYWYHPVTKETRWDEPAEDEPGGARAISTGVVHMLGGSAAVRSRTGAPGTVPYQGASPLPAEVREAAAEGEVARVTAWLCEAPGQVNAVGPGGRTALMAAAHGPRGSAAVRVLVSAGASLEAKDQHGCTALLLAAVRGRAAAAEVLLAAGADADATDAHGGTALHFAAFLGHLAVAKALVTAGADSSVRHPKAAMTAEEMAREAGHDSVLAVLRQGVADAKAAVGAAGEGGGRDGCGGGDGSADGGGSGGAGGSGLVWLSSPAAGALAEAMGPHASLLAANARSVALAQHARKSPRVLPAALATPAGAAQPALVSLWLQQGGHPDADAIDLPTADGTPDRLLALAASVGADVPLQLLIAAKASLDACDAKGRSALVWAASGGHGSAVALLLHAGASPAVTDLKGSTALHAAASAGADVAVEALLQAGAAKDLQDGEGRTALQLAKKAGHTAVVRLLQLPDRPAKPPDLEGQTGKKRDGRPSSDETASPATAGKAGSLGGEAQAGSSSPPLALFQAISQAAESAQAEAAWLKSLQAWMAAGGDVDAYETSMGRTLLMFAAQENRLQAAQALLRSGANPDVISVQGAMRTSRPGCSALVLAAASGFAEMIKLLLQVRLGREGWAGAEVRGEVHTGGGGGRPGHSRAQEERECVNGPWTALSRLVHRHLRSPR